MKLDFYSQSEHSAPREMARASFMDTSPWIAELFDRAKNGDESVRNHASGSIANIEMPAGWTRGKHSESAMGTKYDEFLPPGASDNSSRIQIYERGLKVGTNHAENFRKVLSSEDHQLDTSELKSLGTVLDNKKRDNEFRIDKGWTETFNGKRVLFVEGEFLEDQKKNLSMIIDLDGTGARTQEVSYLAPKDRYDERRGEAIDCFKSVKWK